MSLVLQETRVLVKCYSHEDLTKKQVKKVLFIKDRQNPFCRDLMLKLDTICFYQNLQNQNFHIWFLAHAEIFV